jgi:SAM-dependent methyltransferase
MRLSAVEHALHTLRTFGVTYQGAKTMDVGGTRQVWLEVPRRTPLSAKEKMRTRLLDLLGATVTPAATDVIVTETPLLTSVPGIQFFDRGFNAAAIDTVADIEGDFLLERDVAPLVNQFDIVFCFDTLEHVSDPFAFCRNLVRIARPGGHIYLATVFSWEYHPSPKDYFRFSPDGLRECFANAGGKILDCGWHKEGVSVYIFLQRYE